MAYSRDKLLPSKIKAQSKAFIDKNLQLQIPGCEAHVDQADDYPYSPIYSHYIGNDPTYFPSQINEEDLFHAMKEAEQSYEAWKQMQQQLQKEATKNRPFA